MVIRQATTRECEMLFRKQLERNGYRPNRPDRFGRYQKRWRGPRASVSLVQSNSASASTQSQAVVLSGAVAAGDLIIVGVNFGSSVGGTYTCTDGAGNTYTEFPNVVKGNASFNDLTAFWAINTSGQSSLTITVGAPGGVNHTLRVAAFEYSATNGWQSSPVDQGNSGNSTVAVTTLSSGNITPTISGTLAWSAIQFAVVTNSLTVTSPYTEQPSSGGTAQTGWRSDGRADSGDNQNASTSSQNCTFSWANASACSSLIANFKPASAPAPVTAPDLTPGAGGVALQYGNTVAW